MLNKRLLFTSALLLGAMVGCRQAPIATLRVYAANTVTQDHPNTCAGGLKAEVSLSNVEIYSNTLAMGKEDTSGTGTPMIPEGHDLVYEGAPVVAEAWCLDEDGNEVGYAKKQGELNAYDRSDAIYITPAVPGNLDCTPQVKRGDFPCIESRVIK